MSLYSLHPHPDLVLRLSRVLGSRSIVATTTAVCSLLVDSLATSHSIVGSTRPENPASDECLDGLPITEGIHVLGIVDSSSFLLGGEESLQVGSSHVCGIVSNEICKKIVNVTAIIQKSSSFENN